MERELNCGIAGPKSNWQNKNGPRSRIVTATPRSVAFPNLEKGSSFPRPGRVQRAIRRSFMAGEPPLTIDLLRRAYPRTTKYECWHYWHIYQSVRRYAVEVGRLRDRPGQPIVWAPLNLPENDHLSVSHRSANPVKTKDFGLSAPRPNHRKPDSCVVAGR
jgi:hypothetical protein